MVKYGYIRVSSKDQNIARQIEAMKKSGILEHNMYIDKQSGKNFYRINYQCLLEKMNPKDELYVKSIDRLGRDYEEIIREWKYITQKKLVDIIVLDFPLLDTRNQASGLTGKFLSDIVLQILSYVVQIERENIRCRQREGIEIAKKQGKLLGRPKKEKTELFYLLSQKYQSGEISLREGAKYLNISHTTFSRWINDLRKIK